MIPKMKRSDQINELSQVEIKGEFYENSWMAAIDL